MCRHEKLVEAEDEEDEQLPADLGFVSKAMRVLSEDVLSDETYNSTESDISVMGNDFCHYPLT